MAIEATHADEGDLILAPMVRACSLPFRVLCRELGATVAYTPELVDLKVVACTRIERGPAPRRVAELVSPKDRGCVFSSCVGPAVSDHPLIAQLGTASPETVVAAARVLSGFGVDGVDVNLGCCMQFSTQGGMGSALMQRPAVVRDVVHALSRELSPRNIAVSAKMRLLATPELTASFIAEYLVPAGCSTVAIHARTAGETIKAPARWNELGRVCALLAQNPVTTRLRLIANGGVRTHADIAAIRQATGISHVMIGRAAIENASIFAPVPMSFYSVIQRFLELCVDFDNPIGTTKFVILQMLLNLPKTSRDPELVARMSKAKTLRELCIVFDRLQYYDDHHFDSSADDDGKKVRVDGESDDDDD